MQERFNEEETVQNRLIEDNEKEIMQERVECDEGETMQETTGRRNSTRQINGK